MISEQPTRAGSLTRILRVLCGDDDPAMLEELKAPDAEISGLLHFVQKTAATICECLSNRLEGTPSQLAWHHLYRMDAILSRVSARSWIPPIFDGMADDCGIEDDEIAPQKGSADPKSLRMIAEANRQLALFECYASAGRISDGRIGELRQLLQKTRDAYTDGTCHTRCAAISSCLQVIRAIGWSQREVVIFDYDERLEHSEYGQRTCCFGGHPALTGAPTARAARQHADGFCG
jgi:hypothetical protein